MEDSVGVDNAGKIGKGASLIPLATISVDGVLTKDRLVWSEGSRHFISDRCFDEWQDSENFDGKNQTATLASIIHSLGM